MKMFEAGFIKNKKLLEENSRAENLIDLSAEIDRFSSKIDNIEFSSMIGFIGKFGCGKSNFLNQIIDKYQKSSKCFEFDAWKYPERKDLWENFILDIAGKISEKTGTNIERKIEGKNPTEWVEKLSKIGTGLKLTNFKELLNGSPAKRVNDLQTIFLDLLLSIDEKDIYIVIEDIDRSGDNGIFFLETLNHFLKNNEIDKRIIVIIPIGEENYMKEDIKSSYLKSLDYFHNYSLRQVELNLLVEEFFIDEITSNQALKGQIVSFLEGMFKEFPEQITMRLLKHILRSANSNYIALVSKRGDIIDWRLSIVFETAKFINRSNGEHFIKQWKEYKKIGGSDSLFSALINCILQENHIIDGPIYSSIYKKDYSGGVETNKLQTLSHKLPLKFTDFDYTKSSEKDKILYFTHSFKRDKDYLAIIIDYLD